MHTSVMDDVFRIELGRRRGPSLWTVIDSADTDIVSPYRWHAKIGHLTYYAETNMRQARGYKKVLLHTFLTGWSYVDHIDGNGWNNCRLNLRESDDSRNAHNARKRSGSVSVYKGVGWAVAERKWKANINISNDRIYLGWFAPDSEIKAARAYDVAALALCGEHARINFPRTDYDAAMISDQAPQDRLDLRSFVARVVDSFE